jgi:hypothetical protein
LAVSTKLRRAGSCVSLSVTVMPRFLEEDGDESN